MLNSVIQGQFALFVILQTYLYQFNHIIQIARCEFKHCVFGTAHRKDNFCLEIVKTVDIIF